MASELWYLPVEQAPTQAPTQDELNANLGLVKLKQVYSRANNKKGVKEMQVVPTQDEQIKAGVFSIAKKSIDEWNAPTEAPKEDTLADRGGFPKLDIKQAVQRFERSEEQEAEFYRFQIHVITEENGVKYDEMVQECRHLKHARRTAEDLLAGDMGTRIWYVLDTKTKERWAVR